MNKKKVANQLIGKIKSISCQNFVTYDSCIFCPTEYLNIIIGPNGTGKSTLVAAIVLGLGGDPKLLSRSSSIQDYIKNGKTAATIEIEIYKNNSGHAVKLQRNFDENGKSEFKVDAEKVSKKEFLSAVGAYKIQISNLCQFLPQDRVQDFAKMNPQEILHNTITSVCSQDVVDNFNKLKELQKSKSDGKKSLVSNEQRLKETLARVEELKQVLERYNARKEFLIKLNVCNGKKSWLEVDVLKSKAAELALDLRNASKVFNEKEKIYEEIAEKQKTIIQTTAQLSEDANKTKNAVNECLKDVNKVSEQIANSKKSIRDEKIKFDKTKRERALRENDLAEEKKMLNVVTQDLKNAVTEFGSEANQRIKINDYEKKLLELKNTFSNLVKNRSDINRKLDSDYLAELQMVKTKIERSKNVFEINLQRTRDKFPDVYKGVQFIQENRHIFSGRVYNPILLELSVRDPSHAMYIENSVPLRDLLSFVCENKEDMSILVEELCIKRKLAVNVGHAPETSDGQFAPNVPLAHIKKYGFTAYLVDLIEGPQAILDYLCTLYKLHNIPIGTNHVNKVTDNIPQTIRQYYGGDQKYNVSFSKYSDESSLMQLRISGKQLLFSLDTNEQNLLLKRLNELQKITDSLKNERTSIEAKINEIEFERNEVMSAKRAFEAKLAKVEQLMEQVKKQKHMISQIEEEMTSVSEMKEIFERSVRQSLNKIMDLQRAKLVKLKAYQDAVIKNQISKNAVILFKQQNTNLTNEIDEAKRMKTEAMEIRTSIINTLESLKKEYGIKRAQSKAMSNNCEPKDKNFPNKELFNELPNNIEELDDLINDYNARLECMADVDKDVVSEYEAKSNEVEALKTTIEDSLNGEKDIEAEISTTYESWYPEICRVVETLNNQFSAFMESMSYVGEILLANKDVHDFESYGIQIMVQYRANVPLQTLNRHVQSGGERAVAIAVYTLSMQHITNVPFRCVDEINQGMDARNERKIFDMLVNETTQTGRAQYFFVTPKLLTNLKWNDRMSVHTVYNGNHQKAQSFRRCHT